jgi:hypothetical protein
MKNNPWSDENREEIVILGSTNVRIAYANTTRGVRW